MPEAAIGIGCSARQLFPVTRLLNFQHHGNACRRAPHRNVEHVGRNVAHELSSFSKRSRMIFRISSAATLNSTSGLFARRSRSDCRISSPLFPVAQIKNTYPNVA